MAKMKSEYNFLKQNYPSFIVLIKSGNFYISFDEDALIMSCLFSYKLSNNKVGFPVNSIEKVENELIKKGINYIRCNNTTNDIIQKDFQNNNYANYLNIFKKEEFDETLNKLLLDRIDDILKNNKESYEQIRRFIDEL